MPKPQLDKERIKDIFITIFVGACVAFFTTLFEGALEFLRDVDGGVAGGLVSSLWYGVKHLALR